MEWNNYKNIEAGCNKYGNDLLKLAVYLRDKVFKNLKLSIFIENRTLLGLGETTHLLPTTKILNSVVL